jgi:hypothetical protein
VVGGVAGLLESAHDEGGDFGIIFDDEDAHGEGRRLKTEGEGRKAESEGLHRNRCGCAAASAEEPGKRKPAPVDHNEDRCRIDG